MILNKGDVNDLLSYETFISKHPYSSDIEDDKMFVFDKYKI